MRLGTAVLPTLTFSPTLSTNEPKGIQKAEAGLRHLIYIRSGNPASGKMITDAYTSPTESERITDGKVEAEAVLELLDVVET